MPLITATSTNSGKTLVAAALARSFPKAMVIKPLETGCHKLHSGELFPLDADCLRRFAGVERHLDEISFYRFETPVAPAMAAELEGRKLPWEELLSQCEAAKKKGAPFFLEGAGGLLVPITWDKTFLDLAKELKLSILLVVGSRLGAINEAALTFEALRAHNQKTLGFVVNDLYPANDATHGAAVRTNLKAFHNLSKHYRLPLLSHIPFYPDFSYDSAVPLIGELLTGLNLKD